ncbi:MAG: c-type cytochrome [Kiloniellaceae bacterium]
MTAVRRRAWLAAGLLAAGLGFSAAADRAAAEEAAVNPFLGDPQAIAEGRRVYRTRCVICHGRSGGRGPNLFATRLSDEQFLETVINGRKGTQMPAFGYRMSPDDVWMVHAFVKSTDRY